MTNATSEMAQCTKCHHPAIITQRYSGLHLCREHFIRDLEGKAKREIRKNRWLVPHDRIGVAISGGASSAAALTLLLKLTKERRDIRITALHLNEGDKDATERAERLATSAGVDLSIGRRDPSRHLKDDIQSLAEGCTAVATGATLDEEAATVMAAFVSGEIASLRETEEPGCIRWISPFLLNREDEVLLYATLHHDEVFPDEPDTEGMAGVVRDILREYTDRHPSTLYAVSNLGGQIRRATGDPKE